MWRAIIENRFCTYSLDSTAKTPLMWAAIRGHHHLIEMLLNSNSNINIRDMQDNSALFYSLKYGHSECTKILLLNFATVDRKDEEEVKMVGLFRYMLRLSQSIMKIIGKMSYEKRIVMFEERMKNYKA